MINTKKQLKEVLTFEKSKYQINCFQFILGIMGLSERGVIWNYQRKYEYYLNGRHKIRATYYHYRSNRIGLKYGMRIEPNSVDVGMRICHLGLIIIRGHIGKNSVIHINTALVGGGA